MDNQELIVREAFRQAECYREDQGKMAIASDQRAMSFAATIATLAIAVAGGAVFIFDQKIDYAFVGWILVFSTFGLFASVHHALKCAGPCTFEYRGNVPAQWVSDIRSDKQVVDALKEQLSHYDVMIENNITVMEASSKCMIRSVQIFKISVCAALVCGALFAVRALQLSDADLAGSKIIKVPSRAAAP